MGRQEQGRRVPLRRSFQSAWQRASLPKFGEYELIVNDLALPSVSRPLSREGFPQLLDGHEAILFAWRAGPRACLQAVCNMSVTHSHGALARRFRVFATERWPTHGLRVCSPGGTVCKPLQLWRVDDIGGGPEAPGVAGGCRHPRALWLPDPLPTASRLLTGRGVFAHTVTLTRVLPGCSSSTETWRRDWLKCLKTRAPAHSEVCPCEAGRASWEEALTLVTPVHGADPLAHPWAWYKTCL